MDTKLTELWGLIVSGPHASPVEVGLVDRLLPPTAAMLSRFPTRRGEWLSLEPGQRFVLLLGELPRQGKEADGDGRWRWVWEGGTPHGALAPAHQYRVDPFPQDVLKVVRAGVAQWGLPRGWGTQSRPVPIRHVGRVGDRPWLVPAYYRGGAEPEVDTAG